jgi:predicted transcriptional regulator
MCKILLSIKPEYVERIFNNTKRYEYRRIPAKNNVDSIIIYCSYPVMKIVGEIKVKSIISKSPSALWKMTNRCAGISRDKFYEYFNGRNVAYAYEIAEVKKYRRHKNLYDYGLSFPPQSFVYI